MPTRDQAKERLPIGGKTAADVARASPVGRGAVQGALSGVLSGRLKGGCGDAHMRCNKDQAG